MTVRISRIQERLSKKPAKQHTRFRLQAQVRVACPLERRIGMTSAVTGKTDVYLILGDPVDQVRAPESFNLVFERMGIDAVLVPAQVTGPDLAGFAKSTLRAKNVKGFWITIPHKSTIIGLIDSITPLARAAGAVNAVRRMPDGRLEGALFDGEGFIKSLKHFGVQVADRRFLLLGAGGAAAAIGASLASNSETPSQIAFYDPLPGKALDLARRLEILAPGRICAVASNDPKGFDIVVNASPLGLRPNDPLPCDINQLDANAVFIDILMKNQPTPALRAAVARGLVAYPGFEMLIQQADLYLDFFGFGDAAHQVRRDPTFIREQIYADELRATACETIPTT